MNLVYWIILFVVFPPAAFLLAGVKIAGKLLKLVLWGYLIAFFLMVIYVLIAVWF